MRTLRMVSLRPSILSAPAELNAHTPESNQSSQWSEMAHGNEGGTREMEISDLFMMLVPVRPQSNEP